MNIEPSRDPRSKYVLTEKEYPVWQFPPYACGAFYVITLDMLEPVLKIATRPTFKSFKFEDVQMGIIMRQLEVTPQDNGDVFRCWKSYVRHDKTWFVHDFSDYL